MSGIWDSHGSYGVMALHSSRLNTNDVGITPQLGGEEDRVTALARALPQYRDRRNQLISLAKVFHLSCTLLSYGLYGAGCRWGAPFQWASQGVGLVRFIGGLAVVRQGAEYGYPVGEQHVAPWDQYAVSCRQEIESFGKMQCFRGLLECCGRSGLLFNGLLDGLYGVSNAVGGGSKTAVTLFWHDQQIFPLPSSTFNKILFFV